MKKTIQGHNDTGSLMTGEIILPVGAWVKITHADPALPGGSKIMQVTGQSAPSKRARNCAYFKGQGPVPTGDITWELASKPEGVVNAKAESRSIVLTLEQIEDLLKKETEKAKNGTTQPQA